MRHRITDFEPKFDTFHHMPIICIDFFGFEFAYGFKRKTKRMPYSTNKTLHSSC